jgi:SET domain-containing protein
MKDIFIDSRLKIEKSVLPGAEWGVFATEDIPKDVIIETARALKIKNSDSTGNILNNYVYRWDDDTCLIAFGFGSLYNHSDDPHITYVVKEDRIEYYTIRDIKKGEEVFISYGVDWLKNRGIEKKVLEKKDDNKKGGYYEKYLKYKAKYLRIKSENI